MLKFDDAFVRAFGDDLAASIESASWSAQTSVTLCFAKSIRNSGVHRVLVRGYGGMTKRDAVLHSLQKG